MRRGIVGALVVVVLLAAGGIAWRIRGDTAGPIKVGPMTIETAGDAKIVVSGWPRKDGDITVNKGDCELTATIVGNGTFSFHGRFLMSLQSGGMMADARNCRWTFADTTPFTMNGVLLTPSKGATVEFDEAGRVVTRGIEFKQP